MQVHFSANRYSGVMPRRPKTSGPILTSPPPSILFGQSKKPNRLQGVPMNTYPPKTPLEATVIKIERANAPDSPNDVYHIVLNIKTDPQHPPFKYLEGQSIGILAPGTAENGKPHKLRLYSIASPAVGDDGKGNTVSICVKRVVYKDDQGNEKRGVASNFLCDLGLQLNQKVKITGPSGVALLMPEVKNPNMIMVATGTGVAPFRGFLHNRYNARANEKGQTWLFFGVPTKKDLLYQQELEGYRKHRDFKLLTAISREEKTADGRKMYVQDRIAENADAILDLLQKPNTYFYICGLKGMETGIQTALEEASKKRNLDWPKLFETLKNEDRWRVEVY